jgi:D-alanyl-D-alanine carboxypeptidase
MQGPRRSSWAVLVGFLVGIAVLTPSFTSFDPADAAERTKKARTTKAPQKAAQKSTQKASKQKASKGNQKAARRLPPTQPGKDAVIVVDGASGHVILSRNADEPRFPASLTKMMTLYVLFEALDKGSVKLDTQLVTSKHASGMFPTKLGLKPGETISVELAIKAVAVLSANDAAVVVAESLSASESRFAERMTAKARAIGMKATNFENASGLPNPRQVTTANDMALLGRRLAYDYPQYYHFFATPSFTYKGRVYNTHDHLLNMYAGTDGIKTGYTRASGFNLVSSVVRDNKHLVGVVMGGISVPSRDREMMRILSEGFEYAVKNPTLIATANVPWRGGRPPFTNPFKSAPTVVASNDATRVASTLQPADAVLAASSPLPAESVIPVDVVPALPETITLAPFGEPRREITIAIAPTPELIQNQLIPQEGDVPEPSVLDTTSSIKRWAIQIGAFASEPIAEAQLVAYARQALDIFAFSNRYVVPIPGNDGQMLYRARFGMFGEEEARDIRQRMMSVGQTCFAALQVE